MKTGVHASVLGLAAICGLYNAAAWLTRRQTHLAVNAVLYTALAAWEHQHVAHHLAELRKQNEPAAPASANLKLVASDPPLAA